MTTAALPKIPTSDNSETRPVSYNAGFAAPSRCASSGVPVASRTTAPRTVPADFGPAGTGPRTRLRQLGPSTPLRPGRDQPAWIPASPLQQRSRGRPVLPIGVPDLRRRQPADRAAAAQLLAEHPELPRHDLFVAAACADMPAVRRHLGGGRRQPDHGWTARLVAPPVPGVCPPQPDVEQAATLETARLLLDAGANPNDGRFWHNLPTPFTVLTGVLGYGEHANLASPRHRVRPGVARGRGRPKRWPNPLQPHVRRQRRPPRPALRLWPGQ